MSPGSQILALTARKATPKRPTIKIGKRVERKKPKVQIDFLSFCSYLGIQERIEISNNFFFLIKKAQTTAIERPIQPPLSW